MQILYSNAIELCESVLQQYMNNERPMTRMHYNFVQTELQTVINYAVYYYGVVYYRLGNNKKHLISYFENLLPQQLLLK